ncbi:MAG TPA: aspartate aminotransferase family protein [Bryobacteraceae bacterium]|nr:aspartate aminotransferase family protein [Bryobacteraceae bacterium]
MTYDKWMETLTEASSEVSLRDQVMGLERAHLLQNYARYPLVLSRGKGPYVYDTDGKKYLDFIAGIGVNALGHAHPRITKVIRDQAARLIHTSNLYYHEYQGRLAERIAKTSGLQRTFFCNSGTEATEGAMKVLRAHGTRLHPDKYEIISLENSFHGRTLGALSITGQHKYRKDFEPLIPGVRFVRLNDPGALEEVFCEKTCGIIIEGIQGEGGIHPVAAEFARKARALCDKYNALYVADEIQCGVGRPGTYYSYQLFDPALRPDVMVAAKPLGCGLPLGCITTTESAASAIAPGMHGSTFGGNALACRVALEFFDILDELLPSIASTGAYFRMRLQEMAKKFAFVKEVRGAGLMIGMELNAPCKQVVLDCIAEGLLINCTHDVVLRFLPPYIIGEREADAAVKILTKVLKNFRTEAN